MSTGDYPAGRVQSDPEARLRTDPDDADRNVIGAVETDCVSVVAFADWRASDADIRAAIAELRLALEDRS